MSQTKHVYLLKLTSKYPSGIDGLPLLLCFGSFFHSFSLFLLYFQPTRQTYGSPGDSLYTNSTSHDQLVFNQRRVSIVPPPFPIPPPSPLPIVFSIIDVIAEFRVTARKTDFLLI